MIDALDPTFLGLALALALGLLIGTEREREPERSIGVRTFAIVSLAGAASTVLAESYGPWLIGAGLIAVSALVVARLWAKQQRQGGGMTTATAAVVTYLIGALAGSGSWMYAVVLGAAITLLLYWKESIHGLIDRIGEEDFEIIARFVLIALVVLPLLPDQTFGPYDVFNPFKSWFLVVVIVGLNLTGYVMLRIASSSSGAWLGGLVGGLISSTAATISYAGLSRRSRSLSHVAALVILVASAVVYVRVVIELFVASPGLVTHAIAPMAAFTVVLLALAGFVHRRVRGQDVDIPEQRNPARFLLALSVAAVYVVILYAVAIARDLAGDDAIYIVALISGLTDVDALTLSVAQIHYKGDLADDHAWRAIFLATLSNLLFKVSAAAILGSGDLRRAILTTGSAGLAAGGIILWAWP